MSIKQKTEVNLLQFSDIDGEPDQWERQVSRGMGIGPLTATFKFINHSPMFQNNGKPFEATYTKEQLEDARQEIDELMVALRNEIEELDEAKVDLVSRNFEGVREMISSGVIAGIGELLDGVKDGLKIQAWKGHYNNQYVGLEVAREIIDRTLSIPEDEFSYVNHTVSAA